MTVKEAQRQQEEITTADDLSAYVGQWVLVRAGHVIASDVEPSRLLDERQEGDVLNLVVDHPDGVFL